MPQNISYTEGIRLFLGHICISSKLILFSCATRNRQENVVGEEKVKVGKLGEEFWCECLLDCEEKREKRC